MRRDCATHTCAQCARRGWVLGELSGQLERHWRSPTRLADLLALDDEQLIDALTGNDGEQLRVRCARLHPDDDLQTGPRVEKLCLHDPSYPAALTATESPPRLLHVAGGVERLDGLLREPAVAIVGSRHATDYGIETARGLARGLAASGVTVISGLAEGIAAAAHSGALEAGSRTVTVMPGGLNVCYPASRRALYARIRAEGCAISELATGEQAPRWSKTARCRIVAGMARLTIVVEAEERASDLEEARVARELGRAVAAVPGRVCSPVSRGTHALLVEGAQLVRGAQDALDALYGVNARQAPTTAEEIHLPQRLRKVFAQVSAGRDTVAKLEDAGVHPSEAMIALAELELAGALVRGDGGRYLPRG